MHVLAAEQRERERERERERGERGEREREREREERERERERERELFLLWDLNIYLTHFMDIRFTLHCCEHFCVCVCVFYLLVSYELSVST